VPEVCTGSLPPGYIRLNSLKRGSNPRRAYVDIGWNTDDPDTIIDELIKIVSGLHQRFNSASFMVRDPDIDILGTAYRISIPVDWKQSFDTNDNTVG